MQKRLYRSRNDNMIAGVCGGLADYFNIDPVIMRVLFVVLTIGPGIGLLAYIVLWIVVPKARYVVRPNHQEGNPDNMEETPDYDPNSTVEEIQVEDQDNNNGTFIFASLLIVVGAFWLLSNLFTFITFWKIFPVILIAIGVVVLFSHKKGKK